MALEVIADASAVVKALTSQAPDATQLRKRLLTADVHAPHLVDPEVGDALRRMVLQDKLQDHNALAALSTLNTVIDERYPHGPLVRLAWQLRDRVRFYDAIYVSLAARLDVPLMTADQRLARAHDLPCAVEVV